MKALINVIKAELFKVVRKRRTYVLAALWWVLLPVLILIVGRVIFDNFSTDFVENNSPITAQEVVQNVASAFGIARLHLLFPALVSPSGYMVIFALLAALFIGEERAQNMWKTTLVAQPSRWAVLFGKLITTMLVFGVMLFGGFLLSFVYGAIGRSFLPTTFAGDWLGLLRLYGLQWLYSIAGVLFAFLFIWLLRNVALGIVAVFFVPALLEGLYTVYATVVGFQPLNRLNAIFQFLRLQQTLENLPKYFLTSNLYAPARKPLSDVVSAFGGSAGDDLGPLSTILGRGLTLEHAAMVMAGYALVFAAILTWRFLRSDVQ
jgi:ABC-type transport system involved in multi-copper enzyme maturation permease subunit